MSSAVLGIIAETLVNLHAIEPPQLRRQRRVDGVESPRHRADTVTGTTSRLDGVGRLRFDFHTASNSRWCRFFSSIFSYFSLRLPPAMVAAMVARARLPPEAALSHARKLYYQRFPGFREVRSNYFEVCRPEP